MNMSKAEKPLPQITPDKKPFWDAAGRSELLLMKCSVCGRRRHPLYGGDSYMCPGCNTNRPPEWIKSTGKGKIITWTVIHRAFHPAFTEDVPYVVVLALLDEGVRMMADLRGVKPEDVRENMPVEVFFERLSDEITLPQFRPLSV